MIGAPEQPNSEWPTAAIVGTLLGEHIEEVAAKYMGAFTQVPVTTTLPNGLVVAGHADMVFQDRNALADAKSKAGLADIRKEGPSLEHLIQVSIYTVGLVQMGILTEGATAHLIYADRSGQEQVLYEVELDWDRIQYFIGVCVERLTDVLDAQEHIDKGEVEWGRALRDKTPPFCYSPRVMCPFRDLCWEGSEWAPTELIEDPDIIAVVDQFVLVRDSFNESSALKAQLRERLRGVSGKTPSGYSVNWATENTLYVTRVK
jgi:hypothetical protein